MVFQNSTKNIFLILILFFCIFQRQSKGKVLNIFLRTEGQTKKQGKVKYLIEKQEQHFFFNPIPCSHYWIKTLFMQADIVHQSGIINNLHGN